MDQETHSPDRLDRLARFENWLHGRIRRDLTAYLDASSAEYQRLGRIQQLLNEWEFCVRRMLPDTLTHFVQELSELQQTASADRSNPILWAHKLMCLRSIAVRLEEQDRQLAQITAAIKGYAHGVAQRAVRMPPLPHFRRTVWVDWLSVLPCAQVVVEVTKVEIEIRAFLDAGVHPALAQAQASRASCCELQENVLQNYWHKLRAQTKANYVEKRNVDTVLATLGQRYDAEIALSR